MAFDPRQDAQFEELARTLSPSRRRKNLKPRSAFDSLLDYEQYLLEQGVEDDEDDSLLLRDFLTPGPGLAVGLPDSPPGGMAAWFRYGKGIEFAGAGVSRWADQTGNKRHLLQATDTNRPALQADNSILFDGVDNYLKCAAFTLVQPETVYLLGKQVTWTVSDHFFDGNAAGGGRVTQVTASPQINIDAGAGVAELQASGRHVCSNRCGVQRRVVSAASEQHNFYYRRCRRGQHERVYARG